MTTPNCLNLPDPDLDQHRQAILAEQERRANREAIPATVADLAQKYTDSGGDVGDLKAAIDGA